MSTEKIQEKFLTKLWELFRMDEPDLDFGLYRLMHTKAQDVKDFIETDLLAYISQAIGESQESDKEQLEKELTDALQTAKKYGISNPEETDPVKESKAKLESISDRTDAEAEVYDHLYRFFERYYEGGDFLSRRYFTRETPGRASPFAIPYDGEEVKLHWANADQFYVKSSEHFSNFTFDLMQAPDLKNKSGSLSDLEEQYETMRVHFRVVVAAEGEHSDIKASDDQHRYFIISSDNPVEITEQNELSVNFEYRPVQMRGQTKDRIRAKLNQESVSTVFKCLEQIHTTNPQSHRSLTYIQLLATKFSANENDERTLLSKYIDRFTKRQTTDYFIHKDLNAFLCRELDFYLKNEVLNLDGVQDAGPVFIESQLLKVKLIRKIATQLIEFLAQLENFQKKLWLKKKFVTETNYCVTLDRVREELFPEIIANEAQLDEWVQFFAIDDIAGELDVPSFTKPLTLDFLAANRGLVLDTKYFSTDFKERLLASLEDFDEQCDGILANAENFQALNLFQARYRNQVKCTYIDPPYNTGGDGFVYKDAYKHSSWLTMVSDRIEMSRSLFSIHGTLGISIDDNEVHNLDRCLEYHFGRNKIGELAVNRAEGGGLAKHIVKGHDYLLLYANSLENCPPLLKPKDIRGEVIEWHGEKFWVEEDWLRRKFGEYGTLMYEDILEVKGEQKKNEIDKGIEEGIYRLIPKGEGHIVGRLRSLESDGSKFYSVVKFLNADGMREVKNLFPKGGFGFPKPLRLINQYVKGSTFSKRFRQSIVLDYFAGSGTTGHAVINLNRSENSQLKYILVENGRHFDTVLKPRISKVIYSDDWADGIPLNRTSGVSQLFKYIRLESFEDSIQNIEFDSKMTEVLRENVGSTLRKDYFLRYWLDVESRGSKSILNVASFSDPMSYTLSIKKPRSNEYETISVDLIETFNYLIGIRVGRISASQTFVASFKEITDPELPKDQVKKTVVENLKPDADGPWWFRTVVGWVPKNLHLPNNGEKEHTLIIWRKLTEDLEQDNLVLNEWFNRIREDQPKFDVDRIYVNGSSTLMKLKREEDRWAVCLLEEKFLKCMWQDNAE